MSIFESVLTKIPKRKKKTPLKYKIIDADNPYSVPIISLNSLLFPYRAYSGGNGAH